MIRHALRRALPSPGYPGWVAADRTGGGRHLGSILLLMAMPMALLSVTTTVWLLAASFFALRLLGQGAIGIGTLTLTVRWFDRHRGRAFALVALRYAIGAQSSRPRQCSS